MFTAFSVKNFKCIRDSGKVDIKPLTIFIGPNNSGKSSLLQFLLNLKHTIEAKDTESPFSTRQREGYTDIGGYENFIFLNDKKSPLSFKLFFEIWVSDQAFAEHLSQNAEKRKMNMRTESIIRYKQEEIYLDTFIFDVNGKTIKFNPQGDFEQDFMDSAINKMFEKFIETSEPRLSFRKEKFYYVPNVPLGYYVFRLIDQNREKIDKKMEGELLDSLGTFEILNDFQKELYTSFSNLFYIGPLREYPKRIYFVSGEKPTYVGTKGERAVEVLFVTSKTSSEVFQKVNSWVEKLGFGKVSFKKITESLYELYVTHPTIKKGPHDLEVNIAAVGFGASQILPIIVEGFYAPENAIILIEQPEIHLHPKLQAEMGDLLMDIVKSGKRLIIETHSEHLLLRIQRRIAEGLITTDDVAVYYFEQGTGGTKITKLELDRFGRFPNWPKGFFEEDLMEAYEHSKAIAEKIETEGIA